MGLVQKIKDLADERNETFAEIERKVGLSNGQIRRWDKASPKSDNLKLIADHFQVSTDYLLGRTEKEHYYDLTEKDERNIQKDLESMIADLKNSGPLAFSKDGTEMDEATQEALIISLENALRIAKIEAKKKFTPKKYRDE